MDKLKSWCQSKLTKENMIVLALSGILLLVIAIPSGGDKKNGTSVTESGLSDSVPAIMEDTKDETQEAELERRLEEFLSCMEGAGEVKVMLTFSTSKERVVEKDVPSAKEQVEESDVGGGSRSVSQQQQEEATVFTTDEGGRQVPYVKKTLSATVEGVTVLAQGGDSPVIQKKITEMIEALFGVEAHKIRVAKLK